MTSVHTSPRSPAAAERSGEGGGDAGAAAGGARTTWRAALQAGAFPLLGGLAGVGAALIGLLGCSSVAVVGWFLADAGAHGDTRDAMRVGADAWLLGHGSGLDLGGVHYSVVPLGLTLLLALVVHRTARAAARTLPPVDDREAGLGIALLVIGYASTAVVVAVLAATDAARAPLPRAVVGAAVLAAVVGSAAVLTECDRWSLVTDRLPGGSTGPAPVVLAGAVRVAVWGVAAGLVLVVGSLAVHATTVWAMLSAAVPPGSGPGGSSTGDLVAIAMVALLVLPNAALLGAGYLVGPGFAVGTGTTVSATAVSLGPVPAFPLFGALPEPGRQPWFVMLLWAVAVVVTAFAVIRTARRLPASVDVVVDWRLGGVTGALGGVLLGVLTGLGGGALGDGRMADIGTSVVEVALFGAASCGIGGVIGGLLARLVNHLLDRRQVTRETALAAAAAEPDPSPSPSVAERVRRHRESRSRAVPSDDSRPDPASEHDLLAAFIDQTATDPPAATGAWEQGWSEWAAETEWPDAHDEDTAPIQRR